MDADGTGREDCAIAPDRRFHRPRCRRLVRASLAILGTRIPPDAIEKMKKFEGDHQLHKQITEDRVATAWISRDVIFGGESTNKTKDVGTGSQFHPATVQWRTPSGEIGWVQLTQAPMIDATADEHGIKISATGIVRFRIHAKDLVQTKVSEKEWELPGLRIAVDDDAKNFTMEKADDAVDVTYSGMTTMTLGINAAH